MTLKIGVLLSTKGTVLQAVIDEINAGKLDASIECVISNKEKAYGITRARDNGLEAIFVDQKGKSREEFDKEVAAIFDEKGVELVVLIGYLRFLSPWFVQKYQNKIMNVHPSLLPAFGGGMDLNVHEEVLDSGVKFTGCTIHFVTEEVDAGPIILQGVVPVEQEDTADTLKEKVQAKEKELYPEAVRLYSTGKIEVVGNKVIITQ